MLHVAHQSVDTFRAFQVLHFYTKTTKLQKGDLTIIAVSLELERDSVIF